MSTRRFTALGTASQVPTRERNHNGYFLRWDEHGLLFDPGEGTQRQMTRASISATEIDKILITHFHGDHCLGLPGVLQRISLDRSPRTVRLFYPRSGRRYVERLRTCSIYRDEAKIELVEFDEPGVVDRDGPLSIEVQPLNHSVESWGYRLVEEDGVTMLPDRLAELGVAGPSIGELQRRGEVEVNGATVRLADVSVHRPGQTFAFVMDTRRCQGAVALAQGADVFVCESTYLATETEDAIQNGHLTATQAAEIAREAGARQLVLTHFSQRYPDVRAFVEEAAPIHGDVVAVRDGDRVEFRRRRAQE